MSFRKFLNALLILACLITLVETQTFAQNKQRAAKVRQNRKNTGNKPAPTHRNVKYGPYERNVFDLWLAESETPTPLVVYIHGGGFVGGSKNGLNAGLLKECLRSGISVAAIHYRFVTQTPFPAPQHDSARAIQYMRSRAQEWNLDKKRVAAFGGSAGAGISLWLGYHDDLADPDNADPVLRESTRLTCIGSFGGQTTYDPFEIRDWIGGKAWQHPSIYKCYNVKTLEGLENPKLQPLYDEVSAIKHLTKDDPPIFMFYNEPNKPLPENARPGQGIHHPIFAFKLQDELKKLQIESVYHHASTFKGIIHLEMLKLFRKSFDMEK